MPKLNQIIAVEKGVKSQTASKLTDAYQSLQKGPLMTGISRTYRTKEDGGDLYPAEETLVQVNVADVLEDIGVLMARLFDVVAMKDWANTLAQADVVVDGVTLLTRVPATYLLFLEKQLTDIHTLVSKLPTLDASEQWSLDTAVGNWATKPAETVKTKKIPRNHVKAEATDKHPAQVEVYHEDVVQGYWTTVKFSGALPATRVRELVERVEKLQAAVKFAREEANGQDVTDLHVGKPIFDYLFA